MSSTRRPQHSDRKFSAPGGHTPHTGALGRQSRRPARPDGGQCGRSARKRDAPGCGWHPGAYGGANYFLPAALPSPESEERAAMKASCGTSTRPTIFIRFLPSFCFSSSLRLRLMSPP